MNNISLENSSIHFSMKLFANFRKLTLPLPVFDFEKFGASKCQTK
jgi:hypothetical protein